MSVARSLIVALVWLSSGLAGVSAQATPEGEADDPVLQSLITEALARNPELRTAREMQDEARARPAQVEALPDPSLSVPYVNEGLSPSLGSRDFTTLGVIWTQDLPYPGKRSLRSQMLSLEADQAEQQVERARLAVTAAVRRAYYGLVHTRERLALIEEQGRNWQDIATAARERYAVGQGVQQDVLRAQVEVVRIRQFRAEQQAEATTRLAELNRLMARPYDAPLDTPAHFELRPIGQSLDHLLEAADAISPELKNAALAVERDRAGVELARKAFKPDFSVQGGYQNRGGLDGLWQVGLSLRLPIYQRKNASGLAEAQARQRGSESRIEAVRLLLRQRTQERAALAHAAEENIELYAKGIIPQDRLALEAAQANYQAGQVPFLTVLEALSTLYADRETHLGLLLTHENLRTSLAEASLESTGDSAMVGSIRAPGVRSGFMDFATGSATESSMNR